MYLNAPFISRDVVKPDGSSNSLYTEASPKQVSTALRFSSMVMFDWNCCQLRCEPFIGRETLLDSSHRDKSVDYGYGGSPGQK